MRLALATLLVLCMAASAPAQGFPSSAPANTVRAEAQGYDPRTGADATLIPALIPSLLDSVRIDGPLDFCGEPVPLDNPDVRERLEKELLLVLWDRAQVILYIKRSGRFFPYIEQLLAARGMPSDLKYLSVIESALKPHAGSSAGAVGYWQFLRSTGRKYGLRVDDDIDERRNIYTSTRAALDYLAELHDMFGSWTLAAAAYNMGESGLQKRIEEQETSDYYNLWMPLETQGYIFRALAVKMVMSDPAKYGFSLRPEDLYRPVPFDRVTVELPYETPIQLIAKAAGTYFKTIKDLNSHILGNTLGRGTHTLLLPRGSGPAFHERFQALLERNQPQRVEVRTYVVKSGDNLTAIARRFDLPLARLLSLNGLTTKSAIHPGQRLIISK